MGLFTLKKDEPKGGMLPPSMPSGTPTERVIALKSQGKSDNEIIDILRSENYNSNQIFEAMSHADMKTSNDPMPGPDFDSGGMPPPMNDLPPPISGEPIQDNNEQNLNPTQQNQVYEQQQVVEQESISREDVEELVEAVVDEKWNELVEGVNKIIEWKGFVDEKVAKLEEDILNLKSNIETLNKSILSKINDYDKNIVDVGIQVKAMDKVFREVLPTFTENVNKLTRLNKQEKKPVKK